MDILIVEDEPMILKGITFLLKEYVYPDHEEPTIFTAQNGIEANAYLEEHSFDFIFTDIKMPEMNGLELISKWAQKIPITQWVIISGFNEFDYAKQAIQSGVKDYLLKPITKKKMNETVDRLIKNNQELTDSFISISQSQDIIETLEDLVWNLQESELRQCFGDWSDDVSLQTINNIAYRKYLEEIVELLVERLTLKGIKDLNERLTNVKGKNKTEFAESFINNCLDIMNIIRKKRKGNTIDPIEAAKEYIQSNLNDRLNLTDVAEKLGFNPTYFSQLFKKETGESFVSFRRKIRMERAKQLLEMDKMRIIDISNEIGYGDLPHFTKSFKKYTGYTPSEYKQRLGIPVS